jgi:valyl-tRNA synthetase
MDAYDLFGRVRHVPSFLDALNNWYIRRSRDRFWAGEQDAIDTLHTVLEVLCRVAAPLLPLVTEAVYAGSPASAACTSRTDWPAPRRTGPGRRRRSSQGDGPGARRVLCHACPCARPVTPELEAEGIARDLVRQVQQARREAGLAVSDRIELTITAPAEVVAAFEAHRALVEGETLATSATATTAAVPGPVVNVRAVASPG